MERIFWDFLNRSIVAGWMILAVMALRLLLKRAPKWISCLLWGMAAVRLACPFTMESIFSLIPSKETVRHVTDTSAGTLIDSGIRFVDNAVNPVIRESAALACDESVIKDFDMRQKKVYSEALLACSQGRRSAPVCPLAFGEVGVRERIRSVLNYRKPAFWVMAAAVIACGAAAACFMTDPVKETEGFGEAASAGAGKEGGGRETLL